MWSNPQKCRFIYYKRLLILSIKNLNVLNVSVLPQNSTNMQKDKYFSVVFLVNCISGVRKTLFRCASKLLNYK